MERLKYTKAFKLMSMAAFLILLPGISYAASENKDLSQLAGELGLIEWALIGVAFVLFIIILLMGALLKRLAFDKYLSGMSAGTKVLLVFLLSTLTIIGLPAVGVAADSVNSGNWAANLPVILLLSVIALEIVIIFIMLRNIKIVAGLEMKSEKAAKVAGASTLANLWYMMNQSVEIEREEDIMMDHAYDGIQELDNDLPPWWKYGFYVTIVFAVIYLARYHVFQTAPLQLEEFEIAMARAESELEARRAFAPQINEMTVAMLEGEEDLGRGKAIYIANCSACHGQLGEGGIGPNLTDDYWIHGGSINDIFRVTKYGVIEKGMTPWQDILSPHQMAQVSSYIKTLQGTDPPNQKEPQGELWVAEAGTGDEEGGAEAGDEETDEEEATDAEKEDEDILEGE